MTINKFYIQRKDRFCKTKEDLQNLKTSFSEKMTNYPTIQNSRNLEPEKRKEFASSLNKIKDDCANQIEQKSLKLKLRNNERLKRKG